MMAADSTSPSFGDLLDGLAVELDELRADIATVVKQGRKRIATIEAAIATLRPFADAGVDL